MMRDRGILIQSGAGCKSSLNWWVNLIIDYPIIETRLQLAWLCICVSIMQLREAVTTLTLRSGDGSRNSNIVGELDYVIGVN